MTIRFYTSSDKDRWDAYVAQHPNSTHCHLSGWKRVIENAYGHKGYYLLTEDDSKISGILPLFHIKSFIFGNKLISMPFLNYGGILSDNEETKIALLGEVIKLGEELKVNDTELRHINPISSLNPSNTIIPSNSINPISPTNSSYSISCATRTHKVRMFLDLPASKEELLKSFKSKLRSQISRPQKEGMTAIIGGADLIDPFYRVFSVNMRDLGSPVHSKQLFTEILGEFPDRARIDLVSHQGAPVAAGLIISFLNTVEIPWASSLKKYNGLSPNMLLYWSFMEYACDEGFKYFDFGRSTPDEGTYKFKEQWGAKPSPLYWYDIALDGNAKGNGRLEKSKFETFIRYWKKLPVPISNAFGPLIRKHISL